MGIISQFRWRLMEGYCSGANQIATRSKDADFSPDKYAKDLADWVDKEASDFGESVHIMLGVDILKDTYAALNTIPNTKLNLSTAKDTYELASRLGKLIHSIEQDLKGEFPQ